MSYQQYKVVLASSGFELMNIDLLSSLHFPHFEQLRVFSQTYITLDTALCVIITLFLHLLFDVHDFSAIVPLLPHSALGLCFSSDLCVSGVVVMPFFEGTVHTACVS